MTGRPVVSAPTDETARERPHDIPDHIIERMFKARDGGYGRVCVWCGCGIGMNVPTEHYEDCELARRDARDDGRPSVGAGT